MSGGVYVYRGRQVPKEKNTCNTGGRETQSILTVEGDGWQLSDGAPLYDVTHLPCRSARYQPDNQQNGGTPANADPTQFPVTPGGAMPPVDGCKKQDYWVVFVLALESSMLEQQQL